MAFSCTDFTDAILNALGIDVPEEDSENPEAQANMALEVIAQMKADFENAERKRRVITLLNAPQYGPPPPPEFMDGVAN